MQKVKEGIALGIGLALGMTAVQVVLSLVSAAIAYSHYSA
jgi:hypothetical protein